MIERQIIVTWYEPSEKLPPNDDLVIVTVSGTAGNIEYDHALEMASWLSEDGWWFPNIDTENENDEIEVLAWCDLEAYGWRRK